jgi:diadenylate cyclase
MDKISLTLFQIGFVKITIIDVLDILLIAYILYRLYHSLQGTRAIQMAVGLVVILLMSVLVNLLNLSGMVWIFDNLRTIWLIAFVIVFQPELRRLLLNIGQLPLVRRIILVRGSPVLDEAVRACVELSKRGFGGLIVLARNSGLGRVIETGQNLQAEVSTPLIVSIFNPLSPLHDGAIIIQNDLIVAAKCILPLSESSNLGPWLGTRHRAAIGLSEESDAVIVVVSEETRKISVAIDGKLRRNLEEEELLKLLEEATKLKK